MFQYTILAKVICTLWPILQPELQKLANSTESPIDDWMVRLLEYILNDICKEK